jgi:hypothetical protein
LFSAQRHPLAGQPQEHPVQVAFAAFFSVVVILFVILSPFS